MIKESEHYSISASRISYLLFEKYIKINFWSIR